MVATAQAITEGAPPGVKGAADFAAAINAALDGVFDPELPGITIRELGILRDVDIESERVTVWVTPTWAGCPALDEINHNIKEALAGCGRAVEVRQRLAPPWSSRWLAPSARRKLKEMNITPPEHIAAGADAAMLAHRIIECPRCQHRHTRLVSECGSTSCKALFKCPACQNVFEYFKDIG